MPEGLRELAEHNVRRPGHASGTSGLVQGLLVVGTVSRLRPVDQSRARGTGPDASGCGLTKEMLAFRPGPRLG